MTGHMLGDLSESTQKAAPLPEAKQSQPLNDLLPNQTQDQSLLYFTIKEGFKSRKTRVEQSIDAYNSEQNKKNETILRDLSEQAQEAVPVPEVIKSQPLKELSPTQSESHSLLYFTINVCYYLILIILLVNLSSPNMILTLHVLTCLIKGLTCRCHLLTGL